MFYGLDLINGQVRDNRQAGVLEPTMSKIKSLKSALEAATSLLRIDDSIVVGECYLTAGLLGLRLYGFLDSARAEGRGRPARSLGGVRLYHHNHAAHHIPLDVTNRVPAIATAAFFLPTCSRERFPFRQTAG